MFDKNVNKKFLFFRLYKKKFDTFDLPGIRKTQHFLPACIIKFQKIYRQIRHKLNENSNIL